MATIHQIQKQIATAEKNIAGYEKKIAIYDDRLHKAIDAINKLGANITEDDIQVTVSKYGISTIRDYRLNIDRDKYDWNMVSRIEDYRKEKDTNERRRNNEIRRLEELKEQCAKMISDANAYDQAVSGLADALEGAMIGFRSVWFDKMNKYYESRYEYIKNAIPDAKIRRDRTFKILSYFDRTRGWKYRQTSYVYGRIEGIRKNAAEILMDDAAKMDHDDYMAKKAKETEDSWNNGIRLLTDKCHKFGLDEKTIHVASPSMTGKGFQALVTDNKSRVVDVRVIWAAENSVLVTPHIRYIATQRSK